MVRPTSTRTQGGLDYLSVGTLCALPRLLCWDAKVTTLPTGAAAGTLVYSVLTRYELDLLKVLPMPAHLALDEISGALLCGAPFLFLDEGTPITVMPGRHGQALASKLLPVVMDSILDFAAAGRNLRMYITGDALMHDDLRQIPQRYPSVDIALLHLGGTRIAGILLTMDDVQGVRALRLIAPRVAIPIHCDDYTVFKSPLADVARSVEAAGLAGSVHYLDRGQTYTFARPGARPSTQHDVPLTPTPG